MTKALTDLESIKAGVAQQFSRIDQLLGELQELIKPEPLFPNWGLHTDDPRFEIRIEGGESWERPAIIEMREVSPSPKLVGFVEVTREEAFSLIYRLAELVDIRLNLSHKGNA